MKHTRTPSITALSLCGAALLAFGLALNAQDSSPPSSPPAQGTAQHPAKPDFPPADEILKGYQKIVSTPDGKSFYNLFIDPKTHHMIAELPRDFRGQKHFIALTVASGEDYAGLQAGDMYVNWDVYNNDRLALIEPNLETRSTGDDESKNSVNRLFTDRVILDVPILSIVPKGGPLIDLDNLCLNNASSFFGSSVRGLNPKIFKAVRDRVKAFPENVEIEFEVPVNGQLKRLHYSIRLIKPNKEFKPRMADERVGYFTTSYRDFGKFEPTETRTRYINRWHLEKGDKDLQLSPPKEPIVFYIEHTTPIRYRRWVAEGVLAWNKAFEKVGLINAIVVHFQDAKSGQYMDLDPEDARYNFIRWLNNGVGTAIGPSRVNPETGQILDADIILTDGWIRHWWMQFNEILPKVAMEGYTPETLAWLERHPRWDPRIRFASPQKREEIMRERALRGNIPSATHPIAAADSTLLGDNEFDGLTGRISQVNGLCMAANCKTHGLATMYMQMEMANALADEGGTEPSKDGEKKEEEKKKDDADKEQMLDGIPESFIGPLLADLVAHEVGHTLGLRHNFKGSSIYDYEAINSKDMKGKAPFASSVMDYIPVNMRTDGGDVQGDYAMIGVGPYDAWAIEYGYTFADDLKPLLSRAGEPELQYATDEDTDGPDPLARRYDFAKDPLTYAEDQMRLIRKNRENLISEFVKKGESWSKARRGFLITLSAQARTLSMMANWVGGAHVYRHKKGDSERPPIEVVPADKQRQALQFVIANAFDSGAFGLSPEILNHMGLDKWFDDNSYSEESTWPVHDRILSVQASALTGLMNPTTLRRIYDNEFRVPADEDAFTLPELLQTLSNAIWNQLNEVDGEAEYTARKPLIDSLDRNLQREYVERLTDLIGPDTGYTAAYKPIYDLANSELVDLTEKIAGVLEHQNLDAYTKAHLRETKRLIEKSLEASIVLDVKSGNMGGGSIMLLIGEDGQEPQP